MEYFSSQLHPHGPRVSCLVTADTAIPKDPGSFHAYPGEVGWKLHHDYRLEAHPGRTPGQDLLLFVQSWLVFGLLSATVQADDGPILQTVDLLCDGLLDTAEFERALRKWAHWETQNREGRLKRQVDIAYMLNTAKHVVRRNYGLDIFTKRVGYATSEDDPDSISDELALLLMVLGETLSAVNKSIMDDEGIRTAVADDDLDGGWGPSRWTFTQMEKHGWCPHDIRRVHDYFGSQATPLLSTYMTSDRSTSSLVQHRRCTENICDFREGQRLRGLRSNCCLPDCEVANTGSCGAVGPDMTAILDQLMNSSFSSQTERWSGIPVLRFRSPNPDQSDPIELEVHRLESQDVVFDQLVAISHSWNDDWGNGQANKLSSCRLRYLQRMMQDIGHGRDLCFWIDTLIVPSLSHERDSRREQARENAMSHIVEIFQHAKHIVILDEALPPSTPPRSPAIVARSLLNSAWMGSLLAMQRVYVNDKQNDTGESSNSPGSQVYLDQFLRGRHGLRSLAMRYLTRNGRSGSTIASVEQKPSPYSRDWHTSGEITEERNESGTGREMDPPITLVVNGWQMAKWEMTSRMDDKLALATLLCIESRKYQHDHTEASVTDPDTDTQSRIVSFWKMVHNEFPGSIPGHVVFLQGDQLRLDSHLGFGWAPIIRENRNDLELSGTSSPRRGDTDLIPGEGLLVTFPGILLQLPSEPLRRQLLGMDGEEAISFPVSSKGLNEWYSVALTTHGQNIGFLAQVAPRESRLGLILPDRLESEPKIALLVEIHQAASNESDFDRSPEPLNVIYRCQIIRQVQLRREPVFASLDEFEISYSSETASRRMTSVQESGTTTVPRSSQGHGALNVPENQTFIGEWTSNEQKWIVDGYHRDRRVYLPGGVDGWEHKTRETSFQIPYLNSPSPLERAWSYWRSLPHGEDQYLPLGEPKTPDLRARLIAVRSSTASPLRESYGLPRQTLDRARSHPPETPIFWSKFWAPSDDTSSTIPTRLSSTLLVDASDLAVQETTEMIVQFVRIHDLTFHELTFHTLEGAGAFKDALAKLLRFHAAVLWYSAHEAWESELALLVENNVHQICDAVADAMPENTHSVNTILRARSVFPWRQETPLRRFFGTGKCSTFPFARRDFPNLLESLELIISQKHLNFAVYVLEENLIQEYVLSKAHSAYQSENSDPSPMQLALLRVEFVHSMGFPESTILKSLRVLNILRPTWPSLTLRHFEILGPVLLGITAQRLLGTRTEPARVPDHDDMFWDAVTGVSRFFLNDTLDPTERFPEIYSWEVLDVLSAIASSKVHEDNQPQQQSLLWSPLQVLSELAATVTITGCVDTFDVASCGALLYKMWGEDGLDALRLIAAGAFLRTMSRQASDTLSQSLTVQELDEYIIDILKSQGCQHRSKQSAEGIVLDVLFGTRADNILSRSGTKPIFPLSTTSEKVLVIQYPFTSVALREALAWTCAALRPHPSARLRPTENSMMQSQGSSRTIRTPNGLGLLVCTLDPIQEIPVADLGSHRCWAALFASGLVVPHEIHRQWGKGLGMSFDMMTHLSASETYIWVDDESSNQGRVTLPDSQNESVGPDSPVQSGGYILSGYRTALVPTCVSDDGNQIQWHLEASDDWTTIVDHTNLQILKRKWLKIQDISKFTNTTCYVGWYGDAEVLLGTDRISEMPRWSGARTRERTLHKASVAVQAGINTGFLPIGPLAQVTFGRTLNYVSNVQRFKPSVEYNGALLHEQRKTALVIDNDKKRAYLVPKLSLMLHLCRVEAKRSQSNRDTSYGTSPAIPAAMPSVDGCQAALRFFQENEKTIFIGSEAQGGRSTLSQLFLGIHSDLVKAAGLRESPTRKALLKSEVFATEIMGLLDRPDTGSPLRVVTNTRLNAWIRLAALADAVCICSNLGAAIRPVTVGNKQECECYELPHDRYFLAAHMTCLKIILERQSREIEELSRCGELDFGEGYKMQLNAQRLWTKGHHEKHHNFWKRRAEIIQIIQKETGAEGMVRRLLGTGGAAGQRAEEPYLTGVVVFGIRD